MPYIWYNGIRKVVKNMKKTTVYIDEKDFEMLKTNAFLLKCSISELIRKGIKKVCMTDDSELKKAMQSLSEIRKNFNDYSETEIMDIANEEIKAVRRKKKSGN